MTINYHSIPIPPPVAIENLKVMNSDNPQDGQLTDDNGLVPFVGNLDPIHFKVKLVPYQSSSPALPAI